MGILVPTNVSGAILALPNEWLVGWLSGECIDVISLTRHL